MGTNFIPNFDYKYINEDLLNKIQIIKSELELMLKRQIKLEAEVIISTNIGYFIDYLEWISSLQ
jgi:hypothetical protein